MKKKILILFISLNIFFVSVHADELTMLSDDQNALCDFIDIFDKDDEDEQQIKEQDREEMEVETLEEFVEKPTPPSNATVIMRQIGLKMLIGYLAVRGYFENMWMNIKNNAVRFKVWLLHENVMPHQIQNNEHIN